MRLPSNKPPKFDADFPPRKPVRLRERWKPSRPPESSWAPERQLVTNSKQIVQANLQHEVRAGLYNLKPMRRRWRRRGLDFFLMCVFGNGLAIGLLRWIEPSTTTLLLTVSGMIFYTLALGFVIFVQHDEY